MVRLKASSMVETIAAMLILVAVFSVGIMVYFSVLDGSDFAKSEAENILKKHAYETKNQNRFIDERIEQDNLVIIKKVTEKDDLLFLKYSAFDTKGNQLARYSEVIETIQYEN